MKYDVLEVSPVGGWSDASAAVRVLAELDEIYLNRDGIDYSGSVGGVSAAFDYCYSPEGAADRFFVYVEYLSELLPESNINTGVERILIFKAQGSVFPAHCLDATISWIHRNRLCLRTLDEPRLVDVEDAIAWWRS